MLLLIFLTLFTSVVLGAWLALRPKRSVVARRLLSSNSKQLTSERRLEGGFLGRVVAPMFTKAGNRAASILPQNLIRGIDRLLIAANEPWSLPAFMGVWMSAIFGTLAFILYLAAVQDVLTGIQLSVISALLLFFAVIAPYALVRGRAKRRQKSIVRALPDGLDLLVTCVEAGMGADAAFATVTERTDGPLSETFALYLREVGLGRSRRQALQSAADRTGVPDLIGLALSVNRAEELGTTLGDALRIQAKDLRDVRRSRAQEAAQKAPVKMTIPLALCFLPALGTVIIVPSIINLVRFFGETIGA